MEKHKKKERVFAILALVFMLLFMLPIFVGNSEKTMGFIFEHKHTITTFQLIFGCIGVVFYVISLMNKKTVEAILQNKISQEKKKTFNTIIQLINDGKNKEAVDALYDYDNKYN